MRLLILRHAKSGHPPSVDDFDRPLCDTGRRDAPLIGSWLREHGMMPALVLCSPARRTKETLSPILRLTNPRPGIRYDRALYLAGLPVLLQKIRAAPPASPLLLVGHNPGLHELGRALLSPRQAGDAKNLAAQFSRKLPAAGLVIIDFRLGGWQGLRPGSGSLVEFVRPKSLTAFSDQA